MPAQRVVYKDLDLEFIPHPFTGDVPPITDDVAVKRSIKSLVLTAFYERFYQPDLGSAVRASLFENMDRITAQVIADSIRQVIAKYEPRAQDVTVKVSADYDNNAYNATVQFSIANFTDPLSLVVFLERIR